MARSAPAPRTARGPILLVALGVLVAVLPAGWLELVTPVPWEQEILHLVGLAGAGLAAIWPWSISHSPRTTRRLFAWALGGISALGIFVVGRSPLFLVAGFTLLFTGMLDMWLARAHLASREYAERLRGQEGR